MSTPYPRYRAGYAADAAMTAYASNALARRYVRQGVPPDEAARLSAVGMMIAGTCIGWPLLLMLFFTGCGVAGLVQGAPFSGLGAFVAAGFSWYVMWCGMTFCRIAPHRRSRRQFGRARLGYILAWVLGFIPLGVIAIILGGLVDGLVFGPRV